VNGNKRNLNEIGTNLDEKNRFLDRNFMQLAVILLLYYTELD